MSSSYNNLESYVKGGGKLALLVSRDLTRVVGSCITLANRSNRTLYRWNGSVLEEYSRIKFGNNTGHWNSVCTVRDFSKLFDKFIDRRSSSEIVESTGFTLPSSDEDEDSSNAIPDLDQDAILWLPLYQPYLVQDGGTGNRNFDLLDQNMSLCRWALSNEPTSQVNNSWSGKTIIFGGMSGELPNELKSITHTIRWEYPSRTELRELIFGQVGEYQNKEFIEDHYLSDGCGSILDMLGKQSLFINGHLQTLEGRDEFRESKDKFIHEMVTAAQGLDIEDCKIAVLSSFRESMEQNQGMLSKECISRVRDRKVQLLSSDGLLTIEDTSEREEIGGYENIVNEIKKMQSRLNSVELEKYGIKRPKGILLTGVPGCGKSLTAKTISSLLDIPLIGFDLGKITTSLYGETEERMHRALNMATGMAPCVLWIDEFEKMFSSASNSGSNTHEVSQRINAIFLKWMEERKEGVFVVATSNDLSGIKAEYQRTGRWDGTYFFDLPTSNERRSIIENLLSQSHSSGNIKSSLSENEISEVIRLTEYWSGSDIAALILQSKNARFEEWFQNSAQKNIQQPVLTYDDIIRTINSGKITPMKKKDETRLNRIRKEGLVYTPASIYTVDDPQLPIIEEEIPDLGDIVMGLKNLVSRI